MFRLREAVARAEMQGRRIHRVELAMYVFPDSSIGCALNKVCSLMNGKTAGIKPTVVKRICEYLDCDANFLFGINGKEA
jgi:DNA-binding Xre family transcriptional regulator